MEAIVKRVWLTQLAFPLAHFGLFTLFAYISIYYFGHYEPKDGPDGSFEIYLYLIAFATAITSLLYSTTFLLQVNLKWESVKTIPSIHLALPIIACALLQVGIYFPLSLIGNLVGFLLWLLVIPIVLAVASLKFITDKEYVEI